MTHASLYPPRLLKNWADDWADEVVVFDASSCNTHFLKPLNLMIYQSCRYHPGYTSAEFADALANRLGVADTSLLHELTEDALASLHGIGLLESE